MRSPGAAEGSPRRRAGAGITSTRHPLVQECRRLGAHPHRDPAQRLLLEGHRLIDDALDAGVTIEVALAAVFHDDARGRALVERLRASGADVRTAAPEVIKAASQVQTPQGIVAIARRPAPPSEAVLDAPDLFLLVVDRVQDPGNMGTMLRTALAAGVTAVAITPGAVDPFLPKVLRGTMGAALRLPVLRTDVATLASRLPARGARVLVADAHQGVDYREAPVDRPVALVVGSEAHGPDPAWLRTGTRVHIPLVGPAESLNVAVAAALLLYEVVRRGRPGAAGR